MSNLTIAPRSRGTSSFLAAPAIAAGLALVLGMAASVLAQEPPAARTTTTQLEFSLKGVEEGKGAGQRQYLFQAQPLLVEGKLDEAEALIDQVLEFFDKETADKHVDYVSVANREQLERYEKEHPGKRTVVWLDACYGWALAKKGWIASSRQRWKDAESWLNKAVAALPYSAEARIERGFVCTRQGRYDDGVKSYEAAIELARTVPMEKALEAPALRGLGFDLIELKKLPKARKAFRESLAVDPTNRIALGELIYIERLERSWAEQEIGELRRLGRWAEVTAKLDRRIEIAPDDTTARLLRASACAEQGQWAKAIDELETVIKLDNGNPEALYQAALAQLASGRDAEYRRACARMLVKFPVDFDVAPWVASACWVAPDAVEDLATVKTTAEMLHNARVATNETLKKPRPLAETLSNLGRTLYRAGQFDQSVRRLEDSLTHQTTEDLSKFLDLAFLAMAHQRLGHAEEAGRRLAEAEKVLQKSREAKPSPWPLRVAVDRVHKEAVALVRPAEAATKPAKP
jgi:tetratricopeptide (TPR) repeat protein